MKKEIIATRIFNVPIESVWKSWTEPELVMCWWGPDKFTSPGAKIDFNVGSTSFHGLRVPLAAEERMDIVITTDYGVSKTTMHLSDAKLSNAKNAFFINTWLKYLRSHIK